MYFDTKAKVRYGETDQMGVVYHANYIPYFELGREALLEAMGMPYSAIEEAGFMSPVVDVYAKYGSPLKYGDTAVIRTRVTKNGATKTVYSYQIFSEGMDLDNDTPLVTGYSTHCLVDAETFKPVSIKRSLPELFAKYQEIVEPQE